MFRMKLEHAAALNVWLPHVGRLGIAPPRISYVASLGPADDDELMRTMANGCFQLGEPGIEPNTKKACVPATAQLVP